MQIPVGPEQPSDCPINVYPNPASGITYLTNENNISIIELYDLLDERMYSGQGSHEINLFGYSVGCYHLLIYANLGKVYLKKLMLVK